MKVQISVLVASAMLIASFQNCSRVSFEAIPVESASVSSLANTGYEEFKSEKLSSTKDYALDMVWVVDNSGSMTAEANHVRNNVENFIKSLSVKSDFKFMLISKQGSIGLATQIPAALVSDRVLQVNTLIGSTNGPDILLNTLRAKSSFFRPDSKKLIVFVTDDNSTLSSGDFTANLFKVSTFNAENTSVFSFIGLGPQISPCQAKTGQVYQDLAATLQGKTYNICEADWTQHFADLQQSAILTISIQRIFQLSQASVLSIDAVTVNNLKLKESEYTISADRRSISLANDVVLIENSTIGVSYSF